jgi:hypothetical protein
MSIEVFSAVGSHLIKLRKKAFYPGMPFFSVPAIAVWFIVTQFEGSLIFSPSSSVSALSFKSTMSLNGEISEYEGTLLVVPSGAEGFVAPLGKGTLEGVLSSATREELDWNKKFIDIRRDGLVLENRFIDVDYPLTFMLEGVSRDNISFMSNKREAIPELELGTSESIWVSLGATVAAIFSAGLAVGFLKDSIQIFQEDAGSNECPGSEWDHALSCTPKKFQGKLRKLATSDNLRIKRSWPFEARQ